MTFVNIRCTDCGVVQVPGAQVTACVVIGFPLLSTVAFRCPTCRVEIVRSATPDMIQKLIVGGIRVESMPAHELTVPRYGAPLTCDDLLDLALHLGTTDYLAEVAQMEMQR